MNYFSFLGTCAAVPTESRDNVSLLFQINEKAFLVDVSGSPVKKLKILGCDWMGMTGLILTHTHPDHIYGIHSLVHCLGLKHDGEHLKVHSYPGTIKLISSLLEIQFGKEICELPVTLKTVPNDKPVTFYESADISITAVPADHRIESLSLIFFIHDKSFKNESGKFDNKVTIVYSSDTRPNFNIFKFIDNADIVIHETTFLAKDTSLAKKHGHSTTIEAAEFANTLNAKTLYPCHFDLHSGNKIGEYEKELSECFKGNVIIPEELKKYRLIY